MATEILEFLFFKLTVKLQVAERLNFHYCRVWVCVRSLTLGSQNERISVIYFVTTPSPYPGCQRLFMRVFRFRFAARGFGFNRLIKAQSD